jgi:uncharacterized protein (TIGR03435 family)
VTRSAAFVPSCLLLVVAVSGQATQQADSARMPWFDVVSIKPNRSSDLMRSYENTPLRFVARNIPVTTLLIMAYVVPVESIFNGPPWIRSDRFDIEATVSDPAADRRLMMRALLADRFAAVIREISKDGQGYGLVLGRSDGRLGPQIKPSSLQCRPAEPSRASPCRIESEGVGSIVGRGASINQLVRFLGIQLRTEVVDRTGLDGAYDFRLVWAPEQLSAAEPLFPDRPSLGTAVGELGLKLQPETVSKGTIFIERIERPTSN